MQITQKIDDFLFTLFTSAKKGYKQSIKDAIQQYYPYGPYKPKVPIEGMPKDEIKKMAIEIATQGSHGYRPEKMDYRISSIEGKKFSGYHILAYYYVSWALAIPEMLAQTQLPYEDEYKLALSLYKPKKQ